MNRATPRKARPRVSGLAISFMIAAAPVTADASAPVAPPVQASTDAEPCPWPSIRRDYSLIEMHSTGRLSGVQGCGRAVVAWSPFGVATTREGRVIYEIELVFQGLDRQRASGGDHVYVAWALSRDLQESHRIGVVRNGRVNGIVSFNQYVIAVTEESDPQVVERTGPIVLRGRSPTGWLEPFHHHSVDGTGMPVQRRLPTPPDTK